MSRSGRKNWSNLEISKRICKQLILHRIWNSLSQSNIAEDIGTTFQQYQKVEKCYNRIFAEQIVSICTNRGWKEEVILRADPQETLNEWISRDYPYKKDPNVKDVQVRIMPDKYHRIIRFWDVLNKSAPRNYYGENPIPFVVDSIEKGN